jgi:hypothetical protein
MIIFNSTRGGSVTLTTKFNLRQLVQVLVSTDPENDPATGSHATTCTCRENDYSAIGLKYIQ